jgi:hypothetical protein
MCKGTHYFTNPLLKPGSLVVATPSIQVMDDILVLRVLLFFVVGGIIALVILFFTGAAVEVVPVIRNVLFIIH